MLKCLLMPKNRLKSKIPWECTPEDIANMDTQRAICEVCETQLDNKTKLIVWDDAGNLYGYACKFCRSIYDQNDELTTIGGSDSIEERYEA